MTTELIQRDLALEPDDTERLANLAGPFDEHLRQLELRLGVEINNRGNLFRIIGSEHAVGLAEKLLRTLYDATETETLAAHKVHLVLQESGIEELSAREMPADAAVRVAAIEREWALVQADLKRLRP